MAGGTCRTHEAIKKSTKILLAKLQGERLHGRTRCRWEDNIKMNAREIG
jgi:hypothetical protein